MEKAPDSSKTQVDHDSVKDVGILSTIGESKVTNSMKGFGLLLAAEGAGWAENAATKGDDAKWM